jgi:hypothetical protein
MRAEDSDIVNRLMPDNGSGPQAVTAQSASAPASGGGVPKNISVSPSVLRGAAGAAHTIASDLKEPTDKAMRDGRAAAGALQGWQLGGLLDRGLDGWSSAYQALAQRVGLTGKMIAIPRAASSGVTTMCARGSSGGSSDGHLQPSVVP